MLPLRRRRNVFLLPEEAPGDLLFTLHRSQKMCSLPSVVHDELVLAGVNETSTSSVPMQTSQVASEQDLHTLIARVGSRSNFGGDAMDRQWRRVQLRCQTHPKEVAALDRRGRMGLHAACAKKPTMAAVNALLNAMSSDDSCHSGLLHCDNHGRTPLATAIGSNASFRVVKRLLEVAPEASESTDDAGMLPLHLACFGYDIERVELVRLLLEVYPEGAHMASCPLAIVAGRGRTPLHAALEGNATMEVIQILVKAFPNAVISQDSRGSSKSRAAVGNYSGCSSLDWAIRHFVSVDVIRCMVEACPDVIHSHDAMGSLPLRYAVESQRSTDVLECLVDTNAASDIVLDTEMGNTVLYNALCDGRVPQESTVRFLVRLAPQAVNQRAKAGRTPLTLAFQTFEKGVRSAAGRSGTLHLWNIICTMLRAAQYGRLEKSDPILHAAVSRLGPHTIVVKALRQHPEQVRMVDQHGHVPILLALNGPRNDKSAIVVQMLESHPDAAIFTDPEGRSVLSHAACSMSVTPDALGCLIQAHPAALRQLDPLHSLYPFQLAALKKRPRLGPKITHIELQEGNENVNEDLLQLSAIFKLLQAAPDLVHAHRAE